jgi:hypothetical protein
MKLGAHLHHSFWKESQIFSPARQSYVREAIVGCGGA